MENKLIVKEKFGSYTGLRHSIVSEKSGEEFYHKFLNKEFKNSAQKSIVLVVDLDGVRGYSPSFIDEAFGNLVYDFSLSLVKKFLIIKSDDKTFWKDFIETETYPQWEQRRIAKMFPKKTEKHSAYWRYDNNEFHLAN